MESVIIKKENGEALGVLFLHNKEIVLQEFREQMIEELEELCMERHLADGKNEN